MYRTEKIAMLSETKVILFCIANSIPRIALGTNINSAIECLLINFIIKLSNLSAAYALKEKRQI